MPFTRLHRIVLTAACAAALAATGRAQESDADTRQARIENAQAEKARAVHPYVPGRFERIATDIERRVLEGTTTWHPFLQNAYPGGGFALGAGYRRYTGPYNFVDTRASITFSGYALAEAEFVAPRLFRRRGALSLRGGWRRATQVAFYGVGNSSPVDSRTNFAFEQPYASARLTFWPARRLLLVRAGIEGARWDLTAPGGSAPPIAARYTPATLPGLGEPTTYVHTGATVAIDTRPAPGYARRGGFYGVTAHDYSDAGARFGFRQVDYEAVQHLPILRESWVVSLRGLATTTWDKAGQQVPFYLLPSLGGGSDLRAFPTWRFRDYNALLLQAEWRVMANRFLDTALFVDAGKVASRRQDLDFHGLNTDYGIGARFHGPFSTALRVDLARSREGLRLVVATSPVF
jgi:hypothetical protein